MSTLSANYGFKLAEGTDVFDNDLYLKGNFQIIDEKAVKKKDVLWSNITMTGGATAYPAGGTTYPPAPSYRIDELGKVHFRGLFNGGTAGGVIGTVPVGARPPYTQSFIVVKYGTTDTTQHGKITVKPNGDIVGDIIAGGSNFTHLDGISYWTN